MQFEFLRATEMAALNCFPWIGKGNKDAADLADRSDTLAIVDAILADVVCQVAAQSSEVDEQVAIDSTGIESTAASAYFNTRRGGKALVCGDLAAVGYVCSGTVQTIL